jgi:NAD-dependent dihydropyrimidine dehydrogenase PreA subunit
MAFGPSQENAIMSLEKKTWHGIPREEVPWLPTVDADSCIGCQLCYVTCGRGVYEMREGVAVAVEAMECVVGCSTCGNVCPTAAISFPKLDMVWKLERERQVFRTVKKEALSKHDREAALKARDASMSTARPVVPTRAKVEVAGEFGDKQFLLRLEALIENEPFDIMHLRLEVPTVKGARQKAPSFMSFEVTSERQEAVAPFLDRVTALVREVGLVLVAATPVA